MVKLLKNILGKSQNAAKGALASDKGKQSVKSLIKKGQGVSTLSVSDAGLHDFERLARKYGLDYSIVLDKKQQPPVYTVFVKASDAKVVEHLLGEYADRRLKKMNEKEKPSLLLKLQKYKEKVAAMPRRAVEKMKEAVR